MSGHMYVHFDSNQTREPASSPNSLSPSHSFSCSSLSLSLYTLSHTQARRSKRKGKEEDWRLPPPAKGHGAHLGVEREEPSLPHHFGARKEE
jgi:hypothetical protein